jgi:hypothetical protein
MIDGYHTSFVYHICSCEMGKYIYSLPPIRTFKFTALYLKVLDGNKGLIRSYLDLPECSVNCKALFNIARAPSTASSSRTVSVP